MDTLGMTQPSSYVFLFELNSGVYEPKFQLKLSPDYLCLPQILCKVLASQLEAVPEVKFSAKLNLIKELHRPLHMSSFCK